MSRGINLEPTPEGYRRMAELFRGEIVSSTKTNKTDATIKQLRSLIEIAVYLAVKFPDEYNRLMNPLQTNTKESE